MIHGIRKLWMQRKAMVIVTVFVVSSSAIFGVVRFSNRSPVIPDFELKRGEFLDTVQFSGEVKAMKSEAISAPAEAGDLKILMIHGQQNASAAGRCCRRV